MAPSGTETLCSNTGVEQIDPGQVVDHPACHRTDRNHQRDTNRYQKHATYRRASRGVRVATRIASSSRDCGGAPRVVMALVGRRSRSRWVRTVGGMPVVAGVHVQADEHGDEHRHTCRSAERELDLDEVHPG